MEQNIIQPKGEGEVEAPGLMFLKTKYIVLWSKCFLFDYW